MKFGTDILLQLPVRMSCNNFGISVTVASVSWMYSLTELQSQALNGLFSVEPLNTLFTSF